MLALIPHHPALSFHSHFASIVPSSSFFLIPSLFFSRSLMPRGTYQSVRDRIASHGRSKARTPTPEPTTASGVRPGHALLDTPPRRSKSPKGKSKSPKGKSKPRTSRSTERGDYYTLLRHKSRVHGELSLRGRHRAASLRARGRAPKRQRTRKSQSRSKSIGHTTDAQTDVDAIQTEADDLQTEAEDIDISANIYNTDAEAETPAPRGRSKTRRSVALVDPPAPKPNPPAPRPRGQPRTAPQAAPRGRSQTARKRIRSPTRSPTPGSTDVDPAELEFVTGKTPAGSQYTYTYETVDYDTLVRIAENKVPGSDFKGWPTKHILQALRIVQIDETPALAAARNDPSIEFLPSTPFVVGGGWHLEDPPSSGPAASGSNSSESRLVKRASDESDEHASKRARTDIAENTDTEPESDEAAAIVQPPTPAPAAVASARPAPPLTREDTATTVPESQPSRPQSVVGSQSQPSQSVPKLPMLLAPLSGPTQARLRARLLERVGDYYSRELGDNDPTNELDKFDKPDEPSGPFQGKRTYAKTRSHLPSNPDSLATAAAPPARPNSPTISQTTLLEIERTRARLEKERAAMDTARSKPAAGPSRSRTNAESSRARAARSLIGAATHPDPPARRRPREKENRRLDPISAARADMVAFNDEVAQGNTESFTDSVRRRNRRRQDQDEHTGRCSPIERSLDDLLSDDEELLAQIEAFAKGKTPQPKPPRRRRRNRKKKPLARDFSGIRRQVLVLAKIHLFAFALAEGIYQTRLTFLEWAAEIHYETWKILLPKVPYQVATQAELEVMVNYIATFRGKAKDRLRPVVAHIHEFEHRVATQEDIQRNLDIFNLVYPNSFHCTTYSPRRAGHYENEDIARCIAAALFYAPSSVGVQFPDYFVGMPLTIVAFILALWQFCLEEWSNGWWESRDLSAAHMLDKYEAHLAGLKNLQTIAGNRLSELQDSWLLYAEQYSGASFARPRGGQAITLLSELRPDTPEPERVPRDRRVDYEDEEIDERLMQAARLASLKQAAIERSARDEGESQAGTPTMGTQTPNTSRSRSPTPPLEYNEHGYVTARSKGKGRAN
ncbi:hypothetical protein FS749_002169 [Ceratobasidium sp. UAMH 11750]|nr:hypothetical protein FS749_002169 [Ceratobasidium sp. UAMH 11750]